MLMQIAKLAIKNEPETNERIMVQAHVRCLQKMSITQIEN
jgi:hypothetical protein